MEQDSGDSALVVIHECWSDEEAAIVVSCLADYGIDAVTSSVVSHDIYPLTVDGMGAVRVFAAAEQAEEAKEILEQLVKLNESTETRPSDEE